MCFDRYHIDDHVLRLDGRAVIDTTEARRAPRVPKRSRRIRDKTEVAGRSLIGRFDKVFSEMEVLDG